MSKLEAENVRVRDAWDTNARFWDERMADGNDFFNALVWPGVEHLLRPQPSEVLLDAACGNGVTSRRLAEAGARVLAFDFSEEMIRAATRRHRGDQVDYRVVDATDADARPLFSALTSLLRPAGRFVFSILHPCFNNPAVVQMGELQDDAGTMITTYSVKISRYLTPYTQVGLAMQEQPVPHPYFHRPLGMLLTEGFDAGLVLDALEERAFPAENTGGSTPLSWNGRFSEIPPVLANRGNQVDKPGLS